MQQIVINHCHGGFDLSHQALELYHELCAAAGQTAHLYPRDIARDCPQLVRTVLTLGDKANTRYSELKVVEVPSEVKWSIHEYDGLEWVAEVHRTWS